MAGLLLVRQEQLAVFEAQAKEAFHTRMTSFVREHAKAYVDDLTEEELCSFVDDVIASGAEFGCKTDRDYMLFSMPCAIYGARSEAVQNSWWNFNPLPQVNFIVYRCSSITIDGN